MKELVIEMVDTAKIHTATDIMEKVYKIWYGKECLERLQRHS